MKLSTLILATGFLLTPIIGCKSKDTPQKITEATPEATPQAATSLAVPAEPATSPANDTKRQSWPIIVCFGDSLTAGYGTESGESYPDILQLDLDTAGYKYRIVNQGVSGDTTKDALERVDNVIALKPSIIVVEFGGNDGLRGIPISASRANLDAILAKLKPTGARIALAGMTLPPQYGADYIKQFGETYTILAKKYNLPLLPFLLQDVYGQPGMIQPDGIHATAKGNIAVAKNVLYLLQPLLKKP